MSIRCESCGERATDTSCVACIEEGEEAAYQRGLAEGTKRAAAYVRSLSEMADIGSLPWPVAKALIGKIADDIDRADHLRPDIKDGEGK